MVLVSVVQVWTKSCGSGLGQSDMDIVLCCGQSGSAYVSPDEVLFVLDNAPWCDSDGADFSSGL